MVAAQFRKSFMMRRCFLVLFVAAAMPALLAGPTNSILFVTQVPIPADFGTIASTFGNQQGNPNSCGRGGDLYIRYPDGTLKNLTRAAGYGQWGVQAPNGIAVRQPCVHWSGQKAVFRSGFVYPLSRRHAQKSDTRRWLRTMGSAGTQRHRRPPALRALERTEGGVPIGICISVIPTARSKI